MPRIPRSLLRKASAVDPLLPLLLGPCRDLSTAKNELRWLREHVQRSAKTRGAKEEGVLLKKLVQDRASGKPLQYILGTEYFGELEIACRPGVLIPRQDTAASVTHLARLLSRCRELPAELNILDLCTGSGCIPLLFRHELASRRPEVNLRLLGLDISKNAIDLARLNAKRVYGENLLSDKAIVEFGMANVLLRPIDVPAPGRPFCVMAELNRRRKPHFWDIVISNPPYISPTGYWRTTTRSVRHFEPKRALVPPRVSAFADIQPGEEFYPYLLEEALRVEAKVVLFEVADLDQALRVARMARQFKLYDGNDINGFEGIEIWRDQPNQPPEGECSMDDHSDPEFPIVGTGNGRSVLCWRGKGWGWLGKDKKEYPPI